MGMRKLSGRGICSFDNCPAVWEDGDTIVVRGDVVDQITVDRDQGEAVVRLPASMFQEAAGKLGR